VEDVSRSAGGDGSIFDAAVEVTGLAHRSPLLVQATLNDDAVRLLVANSELDVQFRTQCIFINGSAFTNWDDAYVCRSSLLGLPSVVSARCRTSTAPWPPRHL
jgi:hypothetical protein